MTSTDPFVSVVVPCRNEAAHIERLLEAVRAQTRPVGEVIIVDGASIDDTRERVRAFAARHPAVAIELVEERHVPIPAAVNAGIRRARGPVIVRLDAHCVPRPDYVERALEALAGIEAGSVGGVWEIAPGADSPVARGIALAVAHPLGAGDAAYRTGAGDGRVKDVDTVPFGCFRKAFWERLGGFDERLKTNEDYDFNYRARLAGGRVVLDPGIRSTYFARPTFGRLAGQYFRYGWWKAHMLRRRPASIRWRQMLPPLFVVGTLALAMAGLRWPTLWAVLGGLLGAYALAVLVAALLLRRRKAAWSAIVWVPLALVLVHVTWGAGLLLGLGSLLFRSTGRRPLAT